MSRNIGRGEGLKDSCKNYTAVPTYQSSGRQSHFTNNVSKQHFKYKINESTCNCFSFYVTITCSKLRNSTNFPGKILRLLLKFYAFTWKKMSISGCNPAPANGRLSGQPRQLERRGLRRAKSTYYCLKHHRESKATAVKHPKMSLSLWNIFTPLCVTNWNIKPDSQIVQVNMSLTSYDVITGAALNSDGWTAHWFPKLSLTLYLKSLRLWNVTILHEAWKLEILSSWVIACQLLKFNIP